MNTFFRLDDDMLRDVIGGSAIQSVEGGRRFPLFGLFFALIIRLIDGRGNGGPVMMLR